MKIPARSRARARRNGWNDRSQVHEGFDGCSGGDIHPSDSRRAVILPQILRYLINGTLVCGFAIEAKAFIFEESAEETTPTNDPDSEKRFMSECSKSGQTAEGTAEDVFETVQQVLET
jgi:hypothetical protein